MAMNIYAYSFLALFVFVLASPVEARDQDYGKFSGSVKAEWLEDGRSMKLLEDFQFTDPNGLTWIAPKGSIVDGASIPQLLWSFVGAPFSGEYRDASVIHDVACVEKKRTWEVVHLTFYYAMLASEVREVTAKIIHGAVYHFGPRWPIKEKVLVSKAGTYDVIVGHYTCPPEWICLNARTPIYGKRYVPDRYEERLIFPPKSALNQGEFEALVSEIEQGERTGNPISLEQIQSFGN